MDKKFGQRRICERRKLRNVASALTNNTLAWWKRLCESDELSKTWNDVKILMKKALLIHLMHLILILRYILRRRRKQLLHSQWCIIFCTKPRSSKRRNRNWFTSKKGSIIAYLRYL
jgi:hypothetical protein